MSRTEFEFSKDEEYVAMILDSGKMVVVHGSWMVDGSNAYIGESAIVKKFAPKLKDPFPIRKILKRFASFQEAQIWYVTWKIENLEETTILDLKDDVARPSASVSEQAKKKRTLEKNLRKNNSQRPAVAKLPNLPIQNEKDFQQLEEALEVEENAISLYHTIKAGVGKPKQIMSTIMKFLFSNDIRKEIMKGELGGSWIHFRVHRVVKKAAMCAGNLTEEQFGKKLKSFLKNNQ